MDANKNKPWNLDASSSGLVETRYRRRWHIGTSIRGLAAMSDHKLDEMAPHILVNGKPLRTAAEVRKMLDDALADGMEYIPSDECDHYDERGLCLGHDMEEERDE